MMMLEIIAQHFKNDLTECKEILIGFKVLIFFCKPIVQYLNIDTPNDVIEEA